MDNESSVITTKSMLNPLAAEFIPQQQRVLVVSLPPPSVKGRLMHLDHFLQQLTASPGLYNNLLPSIIQEMRDLSTNATDLQPAVNLIFQECVIHINLRYNGARLCAAIDDYLPQTPFRHLLVQRCVEANDYRKYLIIRNKAQADRLRGFAHFLAELIVHLTVSKDTAYLEDHKAIADLLLDIIQTLLGCVEMDNLLIVSKLLRMTGKHLEDYEIKGDFDFPKMELIFTKVREYAVGDCISKPVRDVLKELISLRENNWSQDDYGFEPATWSAYSGCSSDFSFCSFANSELCADDFEDDIACAYEEYLKETGQSLSE